MINVKNALLATGILVGLASPALAAEIEIKMLNKGEGGYMVFEPNFVEAAPGDTIKFVAADKGHDSASIKGMLPEGAEPFAGDIGKEVSVTVTQEGLYGVECKPHAGMGMVALIQVGAAANLDAFTEAANAMRGKGKERMLEDLAQVQ